MSSEPRTQEEQVVFLEEFAVNSSSLQRLSGLRMPGSPQTVPEPSRGGHSRALYCVEVLKFCGEKKKVMVKNKEAKKSI